MSKNKLRCAKLADLDGIRLLLDGKRSKDLKYRSDEELCRNIQAKRSLVYCKPTTKSGTSGSAQREVIEGYMEVITLTPGDGRMTTDEARGILKAEIAREFHCRDGDLIFYFGALIATEASGPYFLQSLCKWFRSRADEVAKVLSSRHRVIFTFGCLCDNKGLIQRISDKCVSCALSEGTTFHRVLLPNIVPDGSGRKATVSVYYVDPPLLAPQKIRLSCNTHLITETEQKRLMNSSIGFVGLSAGSVALEILLREGIGGKYLLADHDVFEMSDANRMLYGTSADVGRPKVDLCSDRIHGLDPLIEIQKYSHGITIDNAEAFVSSCDLIVEDCGDYAIKFLVRKIAQKLQVPVVMGTSQHNGTIDIERYDIDKQCRPFYIEQTESFFTRISKDGKKRISLSAEEKNELASLLFSKDQSSARVRQTMWNMGKGAQGSSLPRHQASVEEVTLNAVTLANAARRILLGDNNLVSGQFRIRMEHLFMPEQRTVLPSTKV